MQTKNQIMNLLSSENLPSPDVTRPLKSIGDGNMLNGLRTMCSFSYNEGMKKGAIVGGIAVSCVFGTFYIACKGIKYVQSEIFKIKENKKLEEKIKNAFNEDIDNAEIQIKIDTHKEVNDMQMCPFCDKVYDESEYSHCPYCSGELEDDDEEIRPCPECGGCLHWDGDIWECSNCDYSEED